MSVVEKNIPSDTEIQLVASIKQNPSSRAHFVELAKYLESKGLINDSQLVFRGNLPTSLQERHQLDPHPHRRSTKMESCTRLSWYGEEEIALTPPLNEDSMRNSLFTQVQIKTRPEYVDIMENGTLVYDGNNCLYTDKDGTRNSEHSTANSYLLHPRVKSLAPHQHLSGLTLLFTGRNTHNFYHWHYDWLPKFALLEAAGISINDIDSILLNKNTYSFQLQTLQALGIKESQIKLIDPENFSAQCDCALMVRLENRQGMAQSRRHIDWLRSKMLSSLPRMPDTRKGRASKIAVKRAIRGFSDSESVYATLSEKGYECIQLEALPYNEQVSLFSHATHIVAPHGAGLSLLAYSRPGTQVHEFYGDHVQPCFWSISSKLGLDYYNYNGSQLTDGLTTTSNKNLSERLSQPVQVSAQVLAHLP